MKPSSALLSLKPASSQSINNDRITTVADVMVVLGTRSSAVVGGKVMVLCT